jgi:hypothetical protein
MSHAHETNAAQPLDIEVVRKLVAVMWLGSVHGCGTEAAAIFSVLSRMWPGGGLQQAIDAGAAANRSRSIEDEFARAT